MPGEVVDLREDVDAAFATLEAELDGTGAVVTDSTTARSLSAADNGKLIRCTHASGITVTVPAGLPAGMSVELLQEHGVGVVTVDAGVGMTLRYPATFTPVTAEQWSSLVVTILDGNEALVRGDLTAA